MRGRHRRATCRLLSVLALLGCLVALEVAASLAPRSVAAGPAVQSAPPGANDDAIILIDISESVRGIGRGTNNIWPQVQRSVSDLLDLLPDGTNVAIVPFSNGPEEAKAFPQGAGDRDATLRQLPMLSGAERDRARAYVNSLEANGQSTWIVPSLKYALFQHDAWRAARGGQTGLQSIYIYTDGIDNEPPPGKDWIDEASQVMGLRPQDASFLWVAYVQVGPNRPDRCPDRILCAPGAVAPPSIRIVDSRIDFEPLTATRAQSRRQIRLDVRRPVDGAVPLDVEFSFEPAVPGVMIEPRRLDDAQTFEVTLNAPPGTPPGGYKGSLVLRSSEALFVGPNRVPIVFTFQAPTTPTSPPPPSPSPTSPPSPSPTVTSPPVPAATAPPQLPTAPPATPPLVPEDPPREEASWLLWLLGGGLLVVVLGALDNLWRRFE